MRLGKSCNEFQACKIDLSNKIKTAIEIIGTGISIKELEQIKDLIRIKLLIEIK